MIKLLQFFEISILLKMINILTSMMRFFMNERSLKVLEFDKVKELIKKYTRTSGGKEKVDSLVPYETLYEINNKLEETNEALEVLITKGNPPLEGLYDINEAIERAKKGGTLLPESLLKIGNMLRSARLMKEFFKREEEELSLIHI